MTEQKKTARLIEGPIGPMLFNLTFPMIWGILAIVTFNLVDTFFVARLGTEALAALGFTFPVVMILMNCIIGLGIGTSSCVARALGEGDQLYARRLTTHALVLSVVLVGVISMIGLFNIDSIFRLLGAEEEILSIIKEYMQYWFFGIPFLAFPMVANSAVRATGNAKAPGIIMAVSAIVNLILDPIFIFGYFGFPRMEVRGAALATVVSWVITFIAAFVVVYFKEKLIIIERFKWMDVKRSLKNILHVGIPAAFTNMIIPFTIGVLMTMVATFGKEAIAAYGVVVRIEMFSHVIILAISAIIGPFMGQNWGAKKHDRVAKGISIVNRFCIIWGILLAIILAVLSKPIMRVFDSSNEVVEIGFLYFLLVPISYGAHGIIMMISASLNALGHSVMSLIISCVRMFVLTIPLAFLGKMYFGLTGIFLSITIATFLIAIASHYIFKKHFLKMTLTIGEKLS